jgi:hypothetical protein
MTEPVQLLERRLAEIKAMIEKAEENNLLIMDIHSMKQLYNRYYVCIESLKKQITIHIKDDIKK